ncbi:hypothetical protein ACFE04_012143 [Oxalis oulophora]
MEEDLQHLTAIGVLKQSLKLPLYEYKKIFTQITVTLIIPLFILFFTRSYIYHVIFPDCPFFQHSTRVGSKITLFLLFHLIYTTLLLIISLSSISAIVYTIACIYYNDNYNKDMITFNYVVSVIIPRVLKRVLLIFVIQGFKLPFILSTLYFLMLIGVIFVTGGNGIPLMIASSSILAGVISSIRKAKWFFDYRIILGHIVVYVTVLVLGVCYVELLSLVFEVTSDMHLGVKIVVGVSSFFLSVAVFLEAVIIQTLVCFVFKARFQANIVKIMAGGNRIDAPYGEYVAKDVVEFLEL